MKRICSILLLLAFVVAWANPCQAASMSCGMKMPAPEGRCGSCDADGPSTPRLTQGACCSVEPGRERGGDPALLSAPTSGHVAPEKAAIAATADAASHVFELTSSRPSGAPEATGPPSRPTASTILRL